ncbi:MAG: hypothetical protein ACJ8LM_08305 [Candidatus Udaeobacter sp.]
MKTKLVKSMTSCLLFGCALVSLVAAMALGTPGIARADSRGASCGVYTLRGSYLFATHGWNIVGGVAVPKAIVEGIDLNGDGTLVSPFATVSINGTIIHSSGSLGTYTVNTDCTGTLSFTGGASFDIFVEPNGKQLWMIQTGPMPAVFEGVATRVP